jgi:hypothetical protein
MANFSQNYTIAGLETAAFYVPLAGLYTLSGKINLPAARDTGIASNVVTTVKQNSTTIFTSTAGAPGFSIPFNAAAGDEVQVILSSSTPEDEVLNAVNATISLG